MSALDLKALKRAIKTLQEPQGPLARRNARTRVVDALRAVRQALDKEYPAPARKVTTRRTLTPLQKRKELINEGFVLVRGLTLNKLAEAGVAIRTTKQVTTQDHPGNYPIPAGAWAPGWAAYWYEQGGVSKVYEAKKSLTMIKAAKAAIRLGGFKPSTEDIVCPTR